METTPNHTPKLKRVLISGGGTGGHIFPALSIANALRRRIPDVDILFVGAEGRMEMERVPAAGYPIKGLPVAGFDRKRIWRNFSVLIKLYKSMRKARRILKEFDPQIAIGVGGFASGPMLKAAQKKGIPTLIQEQNSYAGVTNKLLAARAKRICTAYTGMERFFPAESIVLTGNPVRASLLECNATPAEAKKALDFDADKPLVMVVGGSLGSLTLNRSMAKAVEAIVGAGAQVLWQTGRHYYAEYSSYNDSARGVQVKEFINNMDLAYRAGDIVVSRAGAGTISELQLLGKPVILVPSPNVAEDHQRKNAQALVDKDAAIMILDADAESRLTDEITALLANEPRRQSLAKNIAAMALPDADSRIADIAIDIVTNTSHTK